MSGEVQSAYGLRSREGRGDGSHHHSEPGERALAQADEQDDAILCALCLTPLSALSQRLEMQGSHRHTFANPHGIVFHIGCFTNARCRYAGTPTTEFTWFRGFRWRFAFCAACLVHVGWRFSSQGGTRFHGLILDRLVFPDRS
jgi:hypothetical protein